MDTFVDKLVRAIPIAGLLMMFKDRGQARFDQDRVDYAIEFPTDMSQAQIEDFIRSIGSNLIGGSTWRGVPSIAFEIWSSPTGIEPRIRIPRAAATYIATQLHGAIPGIDLRELDASQEVEFLAGATINMANPNESLAINTVQGLSNRVLRTLQSTIEEGDTVAIQWVLAHSYDQKIPPTDEPVASARGGMIRWALGSPPAGRDELQSRRQKQYDQNFIAIGRIAATAKGEDRANHLADLVVRAYTSESGAAYLYANRAKPTQITRDILAARTPMHFTAQLSASEVAGVIGWPIGSEYFPGLTRGATVHMPAKEEVPRQGIVIGKSTVRGAARPIALSETGEITHSYVGGMTRTGKTTLLVNTIRQKLDRGWGVFVIERDGNLITQALEQIPEHRMSDVYVLGRGSANRYLGFNILRSNSPEIIAGQLASLLDSFYPDSKSIYTNQLVRMGIPVLATLERATIADLVPLADPGTNPATKAWVRSVISGIKDKTYRDFWEEWHSKKPDRIAQDSQALKNRMLELMAPEPVRYLLNQEESSFDPADIVSGNKIFLVDLSEMSEQAAGIIGPTLINSIYNAAKVTAAPNPNALYIDEFHQFMHFANEAIEMFSTAAKRKLELNVATQYIERLPTPVQDAVMTNAGNKLILRSSVKSARIHSTEFANRQITHENFINLPNRVMLARVMTSTKISDPMTIQTYPEPGAEGAFLPPGFRHGRQIRAMSVERHGRSVESIERADQSRRRAPETVGSEQNSKPRGPLDYTPEDR